jgi:DNA-binding transcriptional LysR family regulator
MELRQLEHFIAVAEERHFTNAAARCHIAQSALSRSIRLLEPELGAALLVRTTRLVELTDAGRHLRVEARRTLDAAALARSTSNSSGAGGTRMLIEAVQTGRMDPLCGDAYRATCHAQRANDARDRRGRYPMDLARRSLP